MEKLARAETWEALESLTRIYFVQAAMLLKEGIFEVAPNPSGHLRVWFSWLDTTHCVDNGKTCKVLARINDIVGVDYDVVVRITGLEVQQ